MIGTFERDFPADSPATFFLKLWQIVASAPSADRTLADRRNLDLYKSVSIILARDKLGDVMGELSPIFDKIIESRDLCDALTVMRQINESFRVIHPRERYASPAVSFRPKVPNWLADLQAARLNAGFYGIDEEHMLVPKGPLVTLPRDEFDSYSDRVADKFSALSVVPLKVLDEARPVTIRMHVIDTSADRGLPPAKSSSSCSIGFIPLVEDSAEIEIVHRLDGGRNFVDFRATPDVRAAARLIAAIEKIGQVDIAIAPELVVSQVEALLLPDLLLTTSRPPRLVVAGSGATVDAKKGQPWNESTTLNAIGAVLWQQRKVVPACLDQQRAIQYGLPDPGAGGVVFENNASGDEIVVADVDGLGRCIVLICQDLETSPLAPELIRLFQPDWVFVPILDAGVESGRWAHRRAFELSKLSHARFLVASSTGLGRNPTHADEPACGLAVGPFAKINQDDGRCFAIVRSAQVDPPGCVCLIWGQGKEWDKSTMDGARAFGAKESDA